ncbi:MAG TPA: alpha/beta fold hydrolase [Nocardioidaceae bacterium]|nr:alpha/beta fold hydrolase [Nocardioidaceae bacterium]
MITAEYQFPGFRCRDHVLTVPLDHTGGPGETIEVFGREVVRPDKDPGDLPWLLFLQGGPGDKGDRPSPTHGWLPRALEEFRVLLLDDRGTGRSTPLNRQTLPGRGSAAEQADYLSHFRADSIVADAEHFRRHLVGDDGRWSVLGQSYGGFCALTYLSFAPEGLREVMVAGGVPGIRATADAVYRAAYPRVRGKNQAFFARYPGDRAVVRRIVDLLIDEDVRLPDGDRLTVERFQTIGLELGMAARFDSVHFLLEEAFVDARTLSDHFLRTVETLTSFAAHPLFAVMHESIYGQGAATDWAAHRVRAEFGEFDVVPGSEDPVLLTGEMIFPWQFEQDRALVPLAGAAQEIARRADWPALYDADRLAANGVPVAAAVYHDDMYVDRAMSLDTAARVQGLRAWVTNEHEHDGLRLGDVFDRLLGMARGRV